MTHELLEIPGRRTNQAQFPIVSEREWGPHVRWVGGYDHGAMKAESSGGGLEVASGSLIHTGPNMNINRLQQLINIA